MWAWIKRLLNKRVSPREIERARAMGEHRIQQKAHDVFQVQMLLKDGEWHDIGDQWRYKVDYPYAVAKKEFATREEAIAYGQKAQAFVQAAVETEIARLRQHCNYLYPIEYGAKPLNQSRSDEDLLIEAAQTIYDKL